MIRHERDFPTRHSLTHALAATACAAGLLVAGGCKFFRGDDADAGPMSSPSTTQESYSTEQSVPPSLQPTGRPIVQGPLPLTYLVESNVQLRVTNVASGEEISTFPAIGGQIVHVDRRGVALQGKQVLGAQLAEGTYAIDIVSPDAGVVRVTQTRTRAVPPRPMPRPDPASRPASADAPSAPPESPPTQ